jgi:predicted DNA-binding transcriptional regulator YafY
MASRNIVQGQREEESRRTARVLDIIQQIATAPHHWSRRSLAEHYEMSERQIQKDLTIIRHKLLLQLCRDADGYYFEQMPRLPAARYTFSEALALVLAARAAQAIPGVNSAELAAAIARLESLFPPGVAPLLKHGADRLPQSANAPHRQAMLALLHRALAERRRVSIAYATGSRGGEVNERVVEPYHIMPYVRSWQLIAFCHRRQAVIEFKVDRIQKADLMDETYTIPADFDLEAYLGDGWGLMRGRATEPEDVELIFEPEAGRWVAEEQWHKSQQSETLPDGRVRMSFHVGITPEFMNWITYYGSHVCVVRPESLQVQVADELRKAAALYG